jgi:hypothetical protein
MIGTTLSHYRITAKAGSASDPSRAAPRDLDD